MSGQEPATGAVVIRERRGSAMWLTINRPERRNAINAEVIAAIREGIDAAEADDSVRAIVLTGTGEHAFCAGGDLSPSEDGAPFTVDPADPANFVAGLLRRMADCRLPLIARINGTAAAGGFGLACACDLAVSVDTAKFGVPEVKVGLFPMMILPIMQRMLSRRRLFELCLTGELFTAEQALAMDVLNRVVPAGELDAEVEKLLGAIEAASPSGVRLGKMAFRAMADMSYDEALEYAQLMLPNMARTEDAREGFAAFTGKRKPRWTGR